jgi:hypothetical protein
VVQVDLAREGRRRVILDSDDARVNVRVEGRTIDPGDEMPLQVLYSALKDLWRGSDVLITLPWALNFDTPLVPTLARPRGEPFTWEWLNGWSLSPGWEIRLEPGGEPVVRRRDAWLAGEARLFERTDAQDADGRRDAWERTERVR